MRRSDTVIVVVVCMFVVVIAFWNVINRRKNDKKPKQVTENFGETETLNELYDVTSWVINLDKNKARWKSFQKSYMQSDMKDIPLKRFSAVVGKDLNPETYLSEDALKELEKNEKQGYRTRHYQLSLGGIGCFLSHYELLKKLADSDSDMFFIFEDDVSFPKQTQPLLQSAISNAPKDWDIILFNFARLHGYKENNFIKAMGFWGTSSYVVRKGGALKFLKECDIHKMDAQIDAYMSYLSQKGILNIYAVSERITTTIDEGSDIQFQGVVAENDTEAYVYKGLSV